MPFGTSSCTWDPDTRTLSILSAHGAWSVRLWPEPAAVHIAGPRATASPPLFLELAGMPSPRSPVAIAIALGARTIPEPVRTCVLGFAPASEQLTALRALHRVPELLPLLKERPVLGRLTCTAVEAQRERARELSDGLEAAANGRARRRVLLDWLGLPTTAAFQRMLDRTVAPSCWRPEDLRGLADWSLESPKLVWHLQVLSPGQVRMWEMVHDRGVPHLLTRELLVALQHHTDLPGGVDLAVALDAIALGEQCSGRKAQPCRTGRDLARRMLDALDRMPGADPAAVPRGPGGGVACPIICPAEVRPLATQTAHTLEGVELEHCLEDPAWFARQSEGEGYAFAVVHPAGRVTAWIGSTSEAGVFTLEALHGLRDAAPAVDLEAFVRAWIERHNAWARHLLHGGPRPPGEPVAIPHAAMRFVDLPQDLSRTLMLVGRVAEDLAPLLQPPDVGDHAAAERALLAALPPPRTLEQDVREVLLPMVGALRKDSLRLARLLDKLEPLAAAGRRLTDDELYEYLIEISRSGLYLACFDPSHGVPPPWPPERAKVDLESARPRTHDEPDLPF